MASRIGGQLPLPEFSTLDERTLKVGVLKTKAEFREENERKLRDPNLKYKYRFKALQKLIDDPETTAEDIQREIDKKKSRRKELEDLRRPADKEPRKARKTASETQPRPERSPKRQNIIPIDKFETKDQWKDYTDDKCNETETGNRKHWNARLTKAKDPGYTLDMCKQRLEAERESGRKRAKKHNDKIRIQKQEAARIANEERALAKASTTGTSTTTGAPLPHVRAGSTPQKHLHRRVLSSESLFKHTQGSSPPRNVSKHRDLNRDSPGAVGAAVASHRSREAFEPAVGSPRTAANRSLTTTRSTTVSNNAAESSQSTTKESEQKEASFWDHSGQSHYARGSYSDTSGLSDLAIILYEDTINNGLRKYRC